MKNVCNFVNLFKIPCPRLQLSNLLDVMQCKWSNQILNIILYHSFFTLNLLYFTKRDMHWFLHWTSFFIIYHSLISTCCTSPRDMHWFLHWTSFFIIHHSLLSTCCTSPRDMHWFLRWDTFSIRFGFEPILQQRIKVTPQPLI